ncbi:MAG: NYN domain-containing protein [Candidatus Omnitrophica bacterium]|nr:NYN domain-containing protein [Candidatus Omnitrophota bacterium]
MARSEPKVKNTIVFVDGQSLYRSAKDAFGYFYPNYDIKLLSENICKRQVWALKDIYFYTGVPDPQDNAFWHKFWSKKLSYMGRLGIKIFSRSLRYHNEDFTCPSCKKKYTSLVGHEKGVDVRIALDVIRLAHEKQYDVAIILSQDQDLSEVADEVRRISHEQNRWIKISSSFPISPTKKDNRGINKTDWLTIDRKLYDSCIDPNDYR